MTLESVVEVVGGELPPIEGGELERVPFSQTLRQLRYRKRHASMRLAKACFASEVSLRRSGL